MPLLTTTAGRPSRMQCSRNSQIPSFMKGSPPVTVRRNVPSQSLSESTTRTHSGTLSSPPSWFLQISHIWHFKQHLLIISMLTLVGLHPNTPDVPKTRCCTGATALRKPSFTRFRGNPDDRSPLTGACLSSDLSDERRPSGPA